MKIKKKSRNFYENLMHFEGNSDQKFTAKLTKPSITKFDLLGKNPSYLFSQKNEFQP